MAAILLPCGYESNLISTFLSHSMAAITVGGEYLHPLFILSTFVTQCSYECSMKDG